MEESKVVLYISMSLDGFIATKEDDLSWLSIVQKEGLDYGYGAMIERAGFYVVGSRTYDVILNLTGGEFPQAKELDCYVITRKERAPENGVTFYNGDLKQLVEELKAKGGKDIYCDGGSQIVKLLMEKALIDEYIISIIPIVLGNGIRLFQGGIDQQKLELIKSEHFETGLVQVHYKRPS